MGIRRVLAILEGNDTDALLLEHGQSICRGQGARLDGLFIRRNSTSVPDFLGEAFSTYGMEAVLAALDAAASAASERAHAAFSAMRETGDNGQVGRLMSFVGLPAEAFGDEARLCDLIVMRAPSGDQWREPAAALECAARTSGKPVLAVRENGAPKAVFDCACIAWDGSLEASRAVSGGLELLASANRVHLVCAGHDRRAAGLLDGAMRYLRDHDIQVEVRNPDAGPLSDGRAVLGYAREVAADLLVMGGYGAPLWQQAVERDDTSLLLREAPCAVLLAH
ncbi:universal stress protein [Maricaulis sp. CAU 1757]